LHLENTAPAKSQISKITKSSASLRWMYELSKPVNGLYTTDFGRFGGVPGLG
jgi:hypothetical protein